MPLYEYRCEQCTSYFNELRRCSEMNAKIECPDCGSQETKRNISSFSVVGTNVEKSSVPVPPGSPFT